MRVVPDDLPATFTTATALAAGVHPRDLYGWRDVGDLVELSRGVFRRGDAAPASDPDALAVALRIPRAVVCCLSAAVVHGLTDVIVPEVQVAVRADRSPPRIDYPPTRVFRFAVSTFDLGVTTFEAAPGEWVPVYDGARTVVDLMRLRRRFGEPAALAVLHRYLESSGAKPRVVLGYAKSLGVEGPVRRALDVAMAR